MGRFDEIRELSRVRVLSFLREKEAVFWVFVFPIVLAGVLGFAFRNAGVQPSVVGYVTGDTADAPFAALIEALDADETVDLEPAETPEEAFEALRKKRVDVLLGPPGIDGAGNPERDVRTVLPRLQFDPDRPEAATAELRIRAAMRRAAGLEEPEVSLEPVEEIGSRYVDFLFPGLLGMNLMGTGMWGIGFAIADIRRRQFLKRLMVTPMRQSSFFLGFILSRLVFLALELLVLIGFAMLVLGVPLRGDAVSLFLVSLLGAATFAGLGILVASRARTIEGVSGLMNLVMMPMWLASGVFFSYERFPEATHGVLRLLPLTALNDALRAVMLDGASVFGVLPELGIMLAWAVVTFLVALRIFRWR